MQYLRKISIAFSLVFAVSSFTFFSHVVQAGACDALVMYARAMRVKAANPLRISIRKDPRNSGELQYVYRPGKVSVRHDLRNDYKSFDAELNKYVEGFRALKKYGYEVIDLSDAKQLQILHEEMFWSQRLRAYQNVLEKLGKLDPYGKSYQLPDLLKAASFENAYIHGSKVTKSFSQLSPEDQERVMKIVRFDYQGHYSQFWNASPGTASLVSNLPTLSVAKGFSDLIALDKHRIQAAEYLEMPIVVNITNYDSFN